MERFPNLLGFISHVNRPVKSPQKAFGRRKRDSEGDRVDLLLHSQVVKSRLISGSVGSKLSAGAGLKDLFSRTLAKAQT